MFEDKSSELGANSPDMSRRIIWESYGLENPFSGIGQHGKCLSDELKRLGCPPLILPKKSSLINRIKPLALEVSRRQVSPILERLEASSGPHVLHALSNFNLPAIDLGFGTNLKRVLTVHDLIPELLPTQVSRLLSAYLKLQMPRALSRADVIISVSEWTKSVLEERHPSTRGRVIVIPNGFPELMVETQRPLSASGFPRFLTVARGESYKRLEMVAEILKLAPVGWKWDLVTDSRGEQMLKGLIGKGSGDRLNIYCGISNESLGSLFMHSWVYVQPSLMEGYCLPAAQALAYGRPVLYTKNSGIDEVVGNAGIGLQAHLGAEAWVAALDLLVRDHPNYAQQSLERATASPKWRDVATMTLRAYDML